mgnify:CR=1 FL=1
MNSLQASRNKVLQQIQDACKQAQREPETVQLLAVSKTHPSESLRERSAGENWNFK